MRIIHYTDVPAKPVDDEDAAGVSVRWVISDQHGAPNFAMRVFEVDPGGRTPFHAHDWEHEVFVIAGHGVVVNDGDETPLSPGCAVFIPSGEKHQFRNTGHEVFTFLCLIPHVK